MQKVITPLLYFISSSCEQTHTSRSEVEQKCTKRLARDKLEKHENFSWRKTWRNNVSFCSDHMWYLNTIHSVIIYFLIVWHLFYNRNLAMYEKKTQHTHFRQIWLTSTTCLLKKVVFSFITNVSKWGITQCGVCISEFELFPKNPILRRESKFTDTPKISSLSHINILRCFYFQNYLS